MRTVLVIAESSARPENKSARKFVLSWTSEHPASSYGLGVIQFHNGDILDGFNFRAMRDNLGASIETTDPVKVCRALGVPEGEPGIIRV